MVRSLFGNSNRKLRSTFWGSPFIPVGTNQTECCLPLTNFSVPSRFQTHATQIRPFLDSNRNGCVISTVNWQIAYHYAFATPTGLFCQMVSTPGHPGWIWFVQCPDLICLAAHWSGPATSARRLSAILRVRQSLLDSFLQLGNFHWFLYVMLSYFYDS